MSRLHKMSKKTMRQVCDNYDFFLSDERVVGKIPVVIRVALKDKKK